MLSPLIRPISIKWISFPWQVSWLADQAEPSPSQPFGPVDIRGFVSAYSCGGSVGLG